MGIWDKWKNYRDGQNVKSAQRMGDVLKNKVTTKEQRLEAIEGLQSIDPVVSLPYLIKRYEISIDHGIQDNREKEMIEEFFLKHQEPAREVIKGVVEKAAKISWPLRIAEKLFAKEEYAQLLVSLLNTQHSLFDEESLERTVELLLALKEVDHAEVVPKATALLRNRDEQVRMAAVECLEAHAQKDENVKGVFLNVLQEPASDTNSRLVGLVKSIVDKHQWS